MKNWVKNTEKWGRWMAHPRIMFWVLPFMMLVLIIGTIAQKNIGILEAHRIYFSSFFYAIGFIPLPGGMTLMTIFTLNLLAKFLIKSHWSWQKCGSILTHLGILILCLGSLITFLTSKEGYLLIPEGKTASIVEDYHQRQLVIREQNNIIYTLPHQAFQDGLAITSATLPFTITLDKTCFNCAITRRDVADQEGWTRPGKFMQLNAVPHDLQDENNLTGIEFTVDGYEKYLTFDKFPKPPQITKDGKTYTITIERATRPLPFTVTLKDFKEDQHPGTDMARAYQSLVTITDGGQSWDALIAMNEPLRYRGFTLYQSSFTQTPTTEATVLAVVENKGRLFPYLATFIIALGMIAHLMIRLWHGKEKRSRAVETILVIAIGLLSFLSPDVGRAQSLPTDDFAELPILHEGRTKPLDSFARFELLAFSKKDTYNGQPAIEWLAGTLFNPTEAINDTVFRINNPKTRHALSLEERKRPLYSFVEINKGLDATRDDIRRIMNNPPKNQTADDKDLLQVHEHALQYLFLLRSFSNLLPLNIALSPKWMTKAGLSPNDPIDYFTLKKIEPLVEEDVKKIVARKGDNPERFTKDEQATAMLGLHLQTIREAGTNNRLLRVLPLDTGEEWASPWEIINDGKGSPITQNTIDSWRNIALGWQTNNANLWRESIDTISERLFYNSPHNYSNFNLWLENVYNKIAPFTLAIFFYALAMVMLFLHIALPTNTFRLRFLAYFVAIAATIIALVIQTAGLATRIVLLQRPPVGTLYESILFVGWVAPLIAAWIERVRKNTIGLFVGSVTGVMTGLLAQSMMGEGDTMKMLGAVLNTRFWLTTHVLCITIGYGWCLITSVMAHVILIGQATKRLTHDSMKPLMTTIMTLALFSLLFTTIGTILGGIWADQSWGRFWGWDPKENGALLIVLWLAWLIHGRIAGQINNIVWVGGMAFLSVIVAFAWIGVNLLGVGLHSYGFIEGVFWGLGIFTFFEMMLITGLAVMAHHNKTSEKIHET